MKKNIPDKEIVIRFVVAALIAAFGFLHFTPLWLMYALVAIALVLVFTVLTGFCPFYYFKQKN